MSRRLKTLINKGYIKCTSNKTDRRIFNFYLTEIGRKLFYKYSLKIESSIDGDKQTLDMIKTQLLKLIETTDSWDEDYI